MRTYITMDNSVKEEHLRPHVTKAHEIELVSLIGQTCFDELCAAKTAGTLTDLQMQLINLLTPWLVHIVAIRSISHGRGTITASGLVFATPGNYTSPDGANMNPNRTILSTADYYRSDAETYRERIVDFLKANRTSFPCLPNVCGCDGLPIIFGV